MSAIRENEREEARRLLELVPDEDLPTVRRMLAGLAREAGRPERCEWEVVLAAFDNAGLDDEGELTEAMVARIAEAERAVAEGSVFSDEEVRRRLGL